ncbi:hypothetical protein, partial [Klebsiella pneumoniae]|uniref:hypothetical protein n=1 Tax=Klebsiella pneumoniae TaxID=573 RepID=UPI0027310FC6
MQVEDLLSFIRESETNSLVVVRFKGYAAYPGMKLRVERAARKYLAQTIPFDHSFSLDDSTR